MLSMHTEYTRMDNLVNTQMNGSLHAFYSSAYIPRMDIGDRLDKAMKLAGYTTQAELAKASGVPQPTVNRILKGGGKRGPETATLKRLASACGVTFSWMNGDEDPETIERTEIKVAEPHAEYKAPQIQLIYATPDEITLLTQFRECTVDGQEAIWSAAKIAERDEKKILLLSKKSK